MLLVNVSLDHSLLNASGLSILPINSGQRDIRSVSSLLIPQGYDQNAHYSLVQPADRSLLYKYDGYLAIRKMSCFAPIN